MAHSDTKENPLNINLNHSHTKIDDVIGYPTQIWRATKKYSVNNTLPIAIVNIWLQFSLAYVAAIIITHNNVSYITDVFSSNLMPAYILASVILVAIFIASLIIKFTHQQEIKDQRSKDGNSPIDREIRGGESDGINEIAQNALTIEIVPDIDPIGKRKENFSIVLPISEKQGEILENKRQENRNRVILLTVPYVLSVIIMGGALAKFGFIHIQGWKEWTFIAVAGAVAVVGALIILSKLKSNEVNNKHNIISAPYSPNAIPLLNILIPFTKRRVMSAMENKFESKEENNPISQLEKLLDKHLTNLIDRVCYLFNNNLLEPSNTNIEKTLDGMRKDVATLLNKLEEIIKQSLDGVGNTANQAIIQCLENIDKNVNLLCKKVSEDVKGKLSEMDVKEVMNTIKAIKSAVETIDDRVARLKPGQYTGLAGATFHNERLPSAPKESKDDQLPQQNQDSQANSGKEADAQRVDWKEGIKETGQLKKKIEELERVLEEKENNQPDSGISSEINSTTSKDPQRDEEEILDEELAQLEKEERIEEKREKIKNLKEARPKQKEVKEWKKEINGKPSEFLYYLLESIELAEKSSKEKKVETTLRSFNNKIIIHWKDGSQTICRIEKQGNLPSTKVDFVDQNIQAAFEVACVG